MKLRLSSLPCGISSPARGALFHRVAYSTGVRLFVFLCVFCGYLLADAAGISSLHSLEPGTVSITNTQKHSSWVPVALLFQFDAPANGTITIERLVPCDSDLGTPGSTSFLLSSCVLSNNQHAVWIPDALFSFNLNEVLSITSTATNGTVEIIRKAE